MTVDEGVSTKDPTSTQPREPRRTSRRTFLVAGSAALAATGVAVVSSGGFGQWWTSEEEEPPEKPPAPAPPRPGSWDHVLAQADATAGLRLLGSPWLEWFGGDPTAWSGMYISWLLRDADVPRTADVAELYAALERSGAVGDAPRPGALIFYTRGRVPPHHVGLVTTVTRGVPQTVEGDHPVNLPHAERFVRRFARPWDDLISYAYPAYR
jgi:hypothetical protein